MEGFEVRTRVWREARDLVYNIVNCWKPVVSAMRGAAVGAGLVCGILADVSIATTDAASSMAIRGWVAAGDHAVIIWPLLCGLAKAKLPPAVRCGGRAEAERIGLIWLAGGRGTGCEGGRGCDTSCRRGAERHPLDKVRTERLAADGRADFRCLARHGVHGI